MDIDSALTLLTLGVPCVPKTNPLASAGDVQVFVLNHGFKRFFLEWQRQYGKLVVKKLFDNVLCKPVMLYDPHNNIQLLSDTKSVTIQHLSRMPELVFFSTARYMVSPIHGARMNVYCTTTDMFSSVDASKMEHVYSGTCDATSTIENGRTLLKLVRALDRGVLLVQRDVGNTGGTPDYLITRTSTPSMYMVAKRFTMKHTNDIDTYLFMYAKILRVY